MTQRKMYKQCGGLCNDCLSLKNEEEVKRGANKTNKHHGKLSEVKGIRISCEHCDRRLLLTKRYMNSPLKSTFVTTIKNKNEWAKEY
ncbi:hypothetical protein [Peribacillus frigoritolerans]